MKIIAKAEIKPSYRSSGESTSQPSTLKRQLGQKTLYNIGDCFAYPESESFTKSEARLSSERANRALVSPIKQRTNSANRVFLASSLKSHDETSYQSIFNIPSSNFTVDKNSKKFQSNQTVEAINLERDLTNARDQIKNLSHQLANNSQIISLFEKSLVKMQNRMHHVAQKTDEKDHEIAGLVKLVEKLKQEMNIENKKLETMMEDKQTDNQTSGWFRDQVNRMWKRSKRKEYSPLIETIPRDIPPCNNNHRISESSLEEKIDRICSSAPSTPKFMMKNRFNICDYGNDVDTLRRKLAEKDRLLTELKLQLLSTENQVADLRESTKRLCKQLMSVREENERLQCIMDNNDPSPISSSSSMNDMKDSYMGYSKRVLLILDQWTISCFRILTTTTWAQLDDLIRCKFFEYIHNVDDKYNLGLSERDIGSYKVGKERIERKIPDTSYSDNSHNQNGLSTISPEMLPYGYLYEDNSINICLKTQLDNLAFECGLSKSILRKIALVAQNERRIMIISQQGTGKTFFALKIAHYLGEDSKDISPESSHKDINSEDSLAKILTEFGDIVKDGQSLLVILQNNPDNDLKKLFSQLAMNRAIYQHIILILKNIHLIRDVDYTFSPLDQFKKQDMPIMIATGADNGVSPHYLSVRQGFKCIDWNMIAGEGSDLIIRRHLFRRMVAQHAKSNYKGLKSDWSQMTSILEWICETRRRINKLLIGESSVDLSIISIELFLKCPIDVEESRTWFLNFWNQSLIPALREIAEQSSRKNIVAFTCWAHQTYPWPAGKNSLSSIVDDESQTFD
ncbi:neuron navigator 3-like [Brevipalpus obovatus]|uniref:neuron navigator 3-like n=1 Tax=Brevipalpus obovatus TaxID=246614 RepID=UPI003D9DDD4A